MDQDTFQRAKNALSILGIADQGEWAEQLRLLLQYESAPGDLAGYDGWVEEVMAICNRIELREIERQRKARVSNHIGKQGERQSFVARVEFVLKLEPKPGQEDFGEKWLTVLADDEGNVIKYWNTIKVEAPTVDDLKAKRPAVKGERLSFDAMVAQHDEYKGVKQTLIQRATKGKIAA